MNTLTIDGKIVKLIAIADKEVTKIEIDGVVVWEKPTE